MVNSKYNRVVRSISVVVLVFFSWTFGGFYEIAYAMKDSEQRAISSQQRSKEKRPEEKLREQLKVIELILNDPDTDTHGKSAKVQEKKVEIDEYDKELRKQFVATEKRLKDVGLPQKILERHYDFVKKYEDNLEKLKKNIDAIGQAKTQKEEDAALENAKNHLKELNPPKKHKPLDPNKLPHRTAEPVFKEPRTKPTDFKQVQSAQAYKIENAEGLNSLSSVPIKELTDMIMLASNGTIEGLPSSRTETSYTSSPLWGEGWGEGPGLNSELQPPELLLAATDPPTSADLEETIEVQFTQAIVDKAAELQNDPLKMYEWVRNNIEFVPTYGSIQGADYCLQTKQCNAFDTASLLIALMRVSNIHARYVEGTAEIPIEKVMNWLGGFTDKMEALSLLASAGIPVSGMTVGGEVKYVRMEHIWMEAWIDYFPSRGARHRTGKGEVWIPLDASFKQYNYTQGIDIKSAVPFDAQSFIDRIQATATINEEEGYVTDVDSLFINDTMTDYQTQVEEYINTNYPDATVGDVLGTKEIIPQNFRILLGTLPYRMLVRGTTHSDMPDELRHKIKFEVKKDIFDDLTGTPINITKSLPELAGKKITLSYSPATADDEVVINSYLPKPHADETPIDPSELPESLAAYLINLKPELRIDGEVAATGTEVGMGATEEFKMTFTAPNKSADTIANDIEAGEYLGIGLDLGRISEEQMLSIKAKLEDTKVKLESEDFVGMTKDDILGDLLYTTAISYFAELDVMDYVQARTTGVLATRLPSETIFSYEMAVDKFMDIPMTVSAGGLAMDADRIMVLARALDADAEKPKQFMLASGMNNSALEHSVPEQLFPTSENPAEGISAVKALKIANDQGIPIYTINQTNIDTILPQLQTDSGTILDIQNAVNAGKTVTISKTDIIFNGWTGIGYIIIDPNTGAGAYMISGGMSGGWLILFWASTALLGLVLTSISLGLLPIILISIALSIFQLYGSSFIKYSLGWDNWQVTSKHGIVALADIVSQIILGTIGNMFKGPGADMLVRLMYSISSVVVDWMLFFFAESEVLEKYWAFFIRKNRIGV